MRWPTSLSVKAWLCILEITLNFHVSSAIRYMRNLNGHSCFLDLVLSRFNFLIISWYVSFILHIIVTNSCLILESLSDLPITMPNPNFPTSLRIHCSICSRIINTYLFVNCAWTSSSTTIGRALDLTSSFSSSDWTSSFTSSRLKSCFT